MPDHEKPAKPPSVVSPVVLVVLAVLILAAGVATFLLGQSGATVEQQRDTASRQAGEGRSLASQVQRVCDEGGQPARRLSAVGACRQATSVQAAPAAAAPPAPGVSEGRVRQLVADQLAADPPQDGQPPTTARVAAVVADVLAANPPQDGEDGQDGQDGASAPPATPAEIAVQVAAYCSVDLCRGPQGVPGPGPTAEQIAAGVTAFCAANGDCRGPQGVPGEDGARGVPGPACPESYVLRPVVLAAPDGAAYSDALACVRPESQQPSEPAPGDPQPPLPGT